MRAAAKKSPLPRRWTGQVICFTADNAGLCYLVKHLQVNRPRPEAVQTSLSAWQQAAQASTEPLQLHCGERSSDSTAATLCRAASLLRSRLHVPLLIHAVGTAEPDSGHPGLLRAGVPVQSARWEQTGTASSRGTLTPSRLSTRGAQAAGRLARALGACSNLAATALMHSSCRRSALLRVDVASTQKAAQSRAKLPAGAEALACCIESAGCE